MKLIPITAEAYQTKISTINFSANITFLSPKVSMSIGFLPMVNRCAGTYIFELRGMGSHIPFWLEKELRAKHHEIVPLTYSCCCFFDSSNSRYVNSGSKSVSSVRISAVNEDLIPFPPPPFFFPPQNTSPNNHPELFYFLSFELLLNLQTKKQNSPLYLINYT